MTVVWILFVSSVVILPAVALLGLRWAVRHGEFNDLQKIALSIFDEDEPVGQMTDRFPDAPKDPRSNPAPLKPVASDLASQPSSRLS